MVCLADLILFSCPFARFLFLVVYVHVLSLDSLLCLVHSVQINSAVSDELVLNGSFLALKLFQIT